MTLVQLKYAITVAGQNSLNDAALHVSAIGQKYLEEIAKYKDKSLS